MKRISNETIRFEPQGEIDTSVGEFGGWLEVDMILIWIEVLHGVSRIVRGEVRIGVRDLS